MCMVTISLTMVVTNPLIPLYIHNVTHFYDKAHSKYYNPSRRHVASVQERQLTNTSRLTCR